MGNSKEAGQSASACITQMAAGNKPTADIIALCLAGYVTSSSPADNQTLCH